MSTSTDPNFQQLPGPLTKGFAALAAKHGVDVDAVPTVGQQVAVYRRERGPSQKALGDAAKVRRATVADIEGNRTDPCLSTLRALARELHATFLVTP